MTPNRIAASVFVACWCSITAAIVGNWASSGQACRIALKAVSADVRFRADVKVVWSADQEARIASSLSAGRLAPHGGSQRVAEMGIEERAPHGRPLSDQVRFLASQAGQMASAGKVTT